MLQQDIDRTYDNFFAHENDELSIQLKSVLTEACLEKVWLANYLNMLAYMEFLGARTLINMMAVDEHSTNLRHAHEEIRHSVFLKAAAEGLKQREMSFRDAEDTFCFPATDFYMKRLMAFVHVYLRRKMRSGSLSQPSMYRLLVSYVAGILEKRTIWWYEHLVAAIEESPLGRDGRLVTALRRIVAEEKSHIQVCDDGIMQGEEGSIEDLYTLLQKEKALFARFVYEQHQYLRQLGNIQRLT